MPTLSVTKSYANNTVLTEDMLDDIKDSIETFFNTTKIDGDNIQDSAITTAKIAGTAVTRAKLESVGQQISSSCGNFSTASSSFVDVTNLSLTLTTSGRPVVVALQGEPSGQASFGATAGADYGAIQILRGATVITVELVEGTSLSIGIPVGSVRCLDVVTAGTYTYKVQVKQNDAGTVQVSNARLVAYEL